MAVGDQADVLNRLVSLLPPSWFRNASAEVRAALACAAESHSFVYQLNQYARAQGRLYSSTDGFVEISSLDFFGVRFPRRASESDQSYASRVRAEIFRPRVTRAAVSQALSDLTGYAPVIQEPANPQDTWGWDASYWDLGQWGSTNNNNQFFVTAYRPAGGGIKNIPGWEGGYWDQTLVWVDQTLVTAPVTDAQIYQVVAQTVAAGETAWVQILNHP